MSFRGKRSDEESLSYNYLQMRFLTFVRNDNRMSIEGKRRKERRGISMINYEGMRFLPPEADKALRLE